MKKIIGGFISAIVLSTSAPSYGAATILGVRSCGDFLHEKDKATSEATTIWMLGYVSGISQATGKDALRGISPYAVAAWLDKFCKENPLADTGEAGVKLYLELKKKNGL